MGLDVANHEQNVQDAIKAFSGNRGEARQKRIEIGAIGQGERSGVTAGKNLDGFIALIADLVQAEASR